MSTTPVRDHRDALLGRVELLHPGSALRFAGPHRLVPGGVLTDDGTLLCLPALRAAVDTAAGLLLAWRDAPRRLALAAWRGGRLHPLGQVDASAALLGGAWLTTRRGADARLLRLHDLAPLPAPLGARGGQPWPDGPGLAWADGAALLRLDGDPPRPRVVASLDGGVRTLRVGPHGAVVAATGATIWALAPGCAARPTPLHPPLGEACFSPDGAQAAVEDEHGVALVDLATGAVLDYREGGSPAGWGRWVDVAGELHPWQEEAVDLDLPGPGVRLGGELHGPGGLAWSLRRGEPVGPARTAGADLALLLGADLLLVEGDALLRRDRDEDEPLLELDPDDPALSLEAAGGEALLRTAAGAWRGGATAGSWGRLDEAEAARLPSPAPAALPPALARLGLPLDGWLRAPDGRLWAWQDEGLLLRTPRPVG